MGRINHLVRIASLLLLIIICSGWNHNSLAAVPGAPAGLSGIAGNGEVSLCWDAVDTADEYVIYQSDSLDGLFSFTGRTAVNCFADNSSITNNSTYYYTVTSLNDEGQSSYSTIIEITPVATVLEAPANIKTFAGNTEVTITWDAVTSAVEYNVVRIAPDGTRTVLTPAAPGLSHTDRGLQNGVRYHYVVQTMSTNPGAYSYTVAAVPTPEVPPAPDSLTIEAGSEWAGISWSSVTGATRYIVYHSTGAGGPFEYRGSMEEETFLDTKLTDETVYYYVVTAVNDNGQSAFSQPASAAVSAHNKPQIAQLTGYTDWWRTYLRWDDTPGAVSYSIYRSTTEGVYDFSSPVAITTNRSFIDSETEYGTTYYYRVRTHNASSSTTLSNEVQLTPVTSLSPPAAENIVVTPGNTQATVTFPPVEGARYYRIEISLSEGGPAFKTGSAANDYLSYTATELINDITYWFRVSSLISNTTIYSSDIAAMPRSALPLAPENIEGQAGNGQVSLQWDSVPGATSYTIFRRVDGTNWQQISSVSSQSVFFQDSGLSNGTTYYYNVAAVNGSGTGAWAERNAEFTPTDTSNLAPIGVSSITGNTQATIKWKPVAGSERYYVQIVSGGGAEGVSATKPYCTVDELTNGQEYFVRVRSTSSDSVYSEVISFTPSVDKPLAPLSYLGEIWRTTGNTQASLRWQSVQGAVHYNVYRRMANSLVEPAHIATVQNPFFLDTGLDNGSKYYYGISGVNSNGEGPLTIYEQEITPSVKRNLAPSNLTAKPGNTQLTANWDSVIGTASYQLRIAASPGGSLSDTFVTAPMGRTSGTDYDLTNGQTYYLRVQTSYPAYSAEYGIVDVTPSELLPYAPEGLACVAPGNGRNTIDWDNVDGAVSYNIYRRVEGEGGSGTPSGFSSFSLYNDSSLTNSIRHYYAIAAVNASGEGALSRSERYCTPTAAKPLSPSNIKVISGDGKVHLRWESVSGAEYYSILMSQSPSGPFDYVSSSRELTDVVDSLQNNQLYYFRLQARNSSNESSALSSQVYSIPSAELVDSDLDGIADDWELAFFNSLSICSGSTDYDKDLYSDVQEYLNWKNNITDPSGNSFDPSTVNEPWGVGYIGTRPSSGIFKLVLPVLINGVEKTK